MAESGGLSTGAGFRVELLDHHIDLGTLRTQTAPVIAVIVPLRAQLFHALAELLDPGEGNKRSKMFKLQCTVSNALLTRMCHLQLYIA